MAYLQAAMIAAPLVMQGISMIGNIFKSRKAKKSMKAMNAQMSAQNAQMAAQLKSQMGSVMGPMNSNYMSPSGIQAGGNGIGTMRPGQLPGMFA